MVLDEIGFWWNCFWWNWIFWWKWFWWTCILPFICVTKEITEVMPRKLFLHFRKEKVISSCLDNSIAMTYPHVCKTFVPNDDPGTQPTHPSLDFALILSTPTHDLVPDCKADLWRCIVSTSSTGQKSTTKHSDLCASASMATRRWQARPSRCRWWDANYDALDQLKTAQSHSFVE